MMHPPSVQLLRSMRSSLLPPRAHRVCRLSIPPPPFQSFCQTFPRYLSTSPIPHRPDDSRSRNPHPPRAPPHGHSHRRFDLSTADLKPKAQDRKPATPSKDSKEGEDDSAKPATDLGSFDVLGDVAAPTTAIDACLADGFHLNNGVKIGGGDGCLLVDGEVFTWRPWEAGQEGKSAAQMVNQKGQFEIEEEAFGVLRLLHPKPDLLVLGLGGTVRPISPETRRRINELGIRIEVLDTRNAAAQFNLLATERGVREVAAAMIPLGWR